MVIFSPRAQMSPSRSASQRQLGAVPSAPPGWRCQGNGGGAGPPSRGRTPSQATDRKDRALCGVFPRHRDAVPDARWGYTSPKKGFRALRIQEGSPFDVLAKWISMIFSNAVWQIVRLVHSILCVDSFVVESLFLSICWFLDFLVSFCLVIYNRFTSSLLSSMFPVSITYR